MAGTLADIEAALKIRIGAFEQRLKLEHPECLDEQKHFDEGTAERAYWHYGYMAALKDMLKMLGATHEDPH